MCLRSAKAAGVKASDAERITRIYAREWFDYENLGMHDCIRTSFLWIFIIAESRLYEWSMAFSLGFGLLGERGEEDAMNTCDSLSGPIRQGKRKGVRVLSDNCGMLCLAVVSLAGVAADSRADQVTIHWPHGKTAAVVVERGARGEAIFGRTPPAGSPGEPALPREVIQVLLPPGANPRSVTASLRDPVVEELPGEWDVPPVPPVAISARPGVPIWPQGRTIIKNRDAEIYGANAVWPPSFVTRVTAGELRGWRLAEIHIRPYRYNPATRKLLRLKAARLCIQFDRVSAKVAASVFTGRAAAQTRKSVQDLVVNPEEFAAQYETAPDAEPPAAQSQRYVILTRSYIQSASTQLAAFVSAKQAQGFDVSVVTEAAWGGGTGNAAAENIRSWLAANYASQNIKYVLLIGNPNPSTGDVPMKMTYPQDYNTSYPDCPTDYYYAELTGDWDLDNDGLFGEYDDDCGPGGAERNCEVVVGRIPYYGSVTDLDTILAKIISYGNATEAQAAWRKRALLPMEPSDDSTPGYQLGEEIKNSVLIAKGGWSYHRVYDSTYGLAPPPETTPCDEDNVTAAWTGNPTGAVFWWTHGSNIGASDIMDLSHVGSLDDSLPAFIFECSCLNAYPETPNNLSYSLLRRGGICAISGTRVTWYWIGQTSFAGTTSNSGMTFEYAKRLVLLEMPAGDALQNLKTALAPQSETSWMNYVDFNVYGDPAVGLYTFLPSDGPVLEAEPATTPGTQNTISWQGEQGAPGAEVMSVAGVVDSPATESPTVSDPVPANVRSALPAAPQDFATSTESAPATGPALPMGQTSQTEIVTSSPSVLFRAGEITEAAPSVTTEGGIMTVTNETRPLQPFIPSPNGEQESKPPTESLPSTQTFGETFEGVFPGSSWTLYGSPTWDDTSYEKHGGSWSGWCAESSMNPAGGYTNNMNAWMVYGPFSLSDATSARFTFWYKNLSESGWDYFKWGASTNGTSFYGHQVSGNQSTWRSEECDLSAVPTIGNLCGKSQVWIAFWFTSDSSVCGPTYTGAYVDDIVIEKDFALLADLTPYQKSGWNDRIPIGTTQLAGTDAHAYSGKYSSNQTLYFNWASINQGAIVASNYTVRAEVTGAGGGSWTWSGLASSPGYHTYLTTDQAVGPLAAGAHTFKVWVDYDATVPESGEADNYYERTIIVQSSEPPADLTPYQRTGWNNKIPISIAQGSGTNDHIYTGSFYSDQTLYFNWAALNQGGLGASNYTVHVEVTGTGGGSWDWTGLATAPTYHTYLTTDRAVGPLAAGTHTFKVWVDYGGGVPESDESNNYCERTINVLAAGARADLTPGQKSGWNDEIPIGITRLAGTNAHTYSGSYYNDQTLYFNWASFSQGALGASNYTVHVEVTGTGGGSWDWTGLTTLAGYHTYLTTDQSVGPLAAGNHTFKVWVDYASGVSESDEGNNYYERTIAVQSTAVLADLAPYQRSTWNDKIPIGITQLAGTNAHTYAGTFYSGQTLYFNWAALNQGALGASNYTVHVEVTGTGGGSWDWTGITTAPTYHNYLTTDRAVGPLAAGNHTFKVWVDYAGGVSESDEGNNYYERTINVVSTDVECYAECADNADFNSPQASGWIQATQYTFGGLQSGCTYWYRVKSRRDDTVSAWSNVEHSQQEALSPYDAWKATHFSAKQLADPAISGDAACPAGDGMPNLLKYALALDPHEPRADSLPGAAIANGYLTLAYRRYKQATDIAFLVEACDSLATGTWSAEGLTEISRVDAGDFWWITIRDAFPRASRPSRFMRLSVTKP